MRKFFIRTTKKSGEATLFFQLRSKKHDLNLNHVNTGVKVNISKWIAVQADEEAKDEWKDTPEGREVFRQLRAIDEAITSLLACSEVSKADVEEVTNQLNQLFFDGRANATVYSVNVKECPEVAGEFSIFSVPTLVFLKDNVEYHRHNGVITIDKFLELANK